MFPMAFKKSLSQESSEVVPNVGGAVGKHCGSGVAVASKARLPGCQAARLPAHTPRNTAGL